MRNFFFGKMRVFKVQTDVGIFDVGGRSYSYKKGTLTIKDCFSKVATFINIKHITEV